MESSKGAVAVQRKFGTDCAVLRLKRKKAAHMQAGYISTLNNYLDSALHAQESL